MNAIGKVWAAALLLSPLASGPAAAQTFPKFNGFVVDAANVLPAEQEAALTKRLDDLQKATGNQFVVATIPDLEGYDIADYGNGLIRNWGVGLKDANNGAILLVAPNDRKVRIEVGYGLEPVLTDAFSSVIVNQRILPRFKAGDMAGGIVAGATAVADQLALPDEEARTRVTAAAAEYDRTHRRESSGGGNGGGVPIGLIFWGIVLAAIVIPMLSRRVGGRRYADGGGRRGGGGSLPIILWSVASELSRGSGGGWGGGGGGGSSGGGWMGGGFGGGGGGSGGGGGASGSW